MSGPARDDDAPPVSVRAAPLPTAAERRALAALGAELRTAGYTDRRVARALGLLEWRGTDLDAPWWGRRNLAEGRLGGLVDLLMLGAALPRGMAADILPAAAFDAGIVVQRKHDVIVDGIILPMADDLVWTDRADRSFKDGGLFLPDSTSLALRLALPPDPVARHLDVGAGAGAVTIAAARRATHTVAVDLAPRSPRAVARTAALNGVAVLGPNAAADDPGIQPRLARADTLPDGAAFDRITFVLPLLVSWKGMAEEGPVHTISGQPGLLIEVLDLVAARLAPGGLALLYTQDWPPGRALPDAITAAFGDRPWRGVYWWDTSGDYHGQTLHTGILAIRADATPGWVVEENTAPDSDVRTWWPWLAGLLGEDAGGHNSGREARQGEL